jgi:hypothetical protein
MAISDRLQFEQKKVKNYETEEKANQRAQF